MIKSIFCAPYEKVAARFIFSAEKEFFMLSSLLADGAEWYLFSFKDAMSSCRTVAIWLTLALVVAFIVGLIISKDKLPFLKISGIIALIYAVVLAVIFSVIEFIDGGIKSEVFIPIVVAGTVIIICAVLSAIIGNPSLNKIFLAVGVLVFAGALVAIGIYYSTGKSLEENDLIADQVNQISLYVSAAVLAAVIIALALIFDTSKRGFDTKSIAYAAICIAMSFALSYIRIVKMPQGGSVTIAAFLPLMLYSYMFGTKKGIFAGAIYGLLQALQDPYILHPAQFMLDYVIAFAGIGLAGIFAGFTKLHPSLRFVLGGFIAGVFRFVSAFLSGMFAFGAYAPEGTPAAIYSLTYQATYVPLDVAIVLVVGALIMLSKSLIREIDKVRLYECVNFGESKKESEDSSMNQNEKQEIENLPQKYKPLGAWSYFGYFILFAIPLIGFICMIVFAVSDANINRRSFARSFFCIYILVAIVTVIILVATGVFAAIGLS